MGDVIRTDPDETLSGMDPVGSGLGAGLTAIIRVDGDRLQLVTHPADGRVVAFDDPDAAFAFAVSLECSGSQSAGTVAAPMGVPVHMMEAGVSALDFGPSMGLAA